MFIELRSDDCYYRKFIYKWKFILSEFLNGVYRSLFINFFIDEIVYVLIIYSSSVKVSVEWSNTDSDECDDEYNYRRWII